MSNNDLIKLKQNIGAILKEHRLAKGKSQLEMGIDIDMSANQIGRIERAESNPTVETLYSIAKYFGIDIIDFFKE